MINLICNEYYIPHDNKIMIGMLGGPSSGKDTVCDYLSAILSNPNKKMTEVARDYIEKNNVLYSPFQERIIFDKITEREKEVYSTYQITLNPGAKILAYFYTVLLTPSNHNSAELENLTDMYALCLNAVRDYDYLFFCESLKYDEDGLRYQSDKENNLLQNSIISFLDMHRIQYTYIEAAPVLERCQKILSVIGAKKMEEYSA